PRTERPKGMIFSSWLRLRGRKPKLARAERCATTRSDTFRPRLEVLESRELPSAVAITVHPGESIQAAVDAARPGTVINIEAGTYLQTVSVAKPGIQLIGLDGPGGVLIENPGTADDGITVTRAGQGFVLDNVTVEGFADNGVLLVGVNTFRLSRV